jgi:hypothetical protein
MTLPSEGGIDSGRQWLPSQDGIKRKEAPQGRGRGGLPEAHQATVLETMDLLQVALVLLHLQQQLFQKVLGFFQGVEVQAGCLLVLQGDEGDYFRR